MKNLKTRKDFLKISAAGTLGGIILGPMFYKSLAKGTPEVQPVDRKSFGVGLQLYTIRDAMNADTPGSLKKISDLGYKYVEPASYTNGKFYGYPPAEFKKMVEDLDMKVISSHASVNLTGNVTENAKKMTDDHIALGVKYCIQPYINESDRSVESYKRMICEWNKVGDIMKNAGIQFGYHNHNFEFAPTSELIPYYDIFMKEMDADLITMELDIYWAVKAGQDPIEMFNKYPGRFQLTHFKDMTEKSEPSYGAVKNDMASVGSGLIDYKQIYAARETAGMKYFFVEDDSQGKGKPFEGINTSIKNLTTKILI